MFLQLFVINRSGGLIFQKNISPSAPILSGNESMRLLSTFHGVNAIASQVAPCISSGIDKIETDTFNLYCLQTLTGLKFVVTESIDTSDSEILLQGVYETYADYVLKNPFYEMEMPIRCELFNKNLNKLIQRISANPTRTAAAARNLRV